MKQERSPTGAAATEPEAATAPPEEGRRLHMGIAEQGKVYALEGNHGRALFYYRHAMRLAVEAGDPEVFFRHYLECVIESLEQTGSFDEVLEYCDKALELYEKNPPADPVNLRDQASIYQRRGVVHLKRGDKDGARRAFEDALQALAGSGQKLPLASSLLDWLRRGLHVEPARVDAELRRADYFSVREENVDRSRAVLLPDSLIPPGLAI